jgi:hypothetical protein
MAELARRLRQPRRRNENGLKNAQNDIVEDMEVNSLMVR